MLTELACLQSTLITNWNHLEYHEPKLKTSSVPRSLQTFWRCVADIKITWVNGIFSQFKHFIYFLCSVMNKIWLHDICKINAFGFRLHFTTPSTFWEMGFYKIWTFLKPWMCFFFFYLMPSWYFEIFLIALGREGEEVSNGTFLTFLDLKHR